MLSIKLQEGDSLLQSIVFISIHSNITLDIKIREDESLLQNFVLISFYKYYIRYDTVER